MQKILMLMLCIHSVYAMEKMEIDKKPLVSSFFEKIDKGFNHANQHLSPEMKKALLPIYEDINEQTEPLRKSYLEDEDALNTLYEMILNCPINLDELNLQPKRK